ncbi:hypothetical protein J6590_097864 [Homalodisca vitripennis]|nr:hypothetical protein J6590_097864 [Homalodisca vitripennis]
MENMETAHNLVFNQVGRCFGSRTELTKGVMCEKMRLSQREEDNGVRKRTLSIESSTTTPPAPPRHPHHHATRTAAPHPCDNNCLLKDLRSLFLGTGFLSHPTQIISAQLSENPMLQFYSTNKV